MGGTLGHKLDLEQARPQFAVLRRNPRDPVCLPHIGKNLALNELQLIQLSYGSVAVVDGEAALFLQRVSIQDPDLGASITHKDLLAVGGETPSFASVRKLAQQAEVAQVVDESCL